MKIMNKRKGKKIAVIAAVVMGFMVVAFLPAASAAVTSFSVTPSTGLAGAVDSYTALVTTDGVTTLEITIPAGFIAVAPMTGGVQIARVDFWNSSRPALDYYGYATITSNNANPTTKVDVYCKLRVGGDEVEKWTLNQDVDYTAGALNTFVSGFACDHSAAILKLPTEGDDGCINISINCTECPGFSANWRLDDVSINIGQFVRNPTAAGDYDFKAEEEVATVTIKSAVGLGSAVFRNGRWYIDETGNQKTDKYFWYGTTDDIPVVGEFGSEDYGVFRKGKWFIDTNFDQKTNICFWYGTTGDKPVVGDFDGVGIDDYGVFRNGKWYIDTTGNQKTDLCFWYGTTGDKPVVGDFNGDTKGDYGVFRNGKWYIDTDFDQKTNLCFWYGTTGDKPLFTSDLG